jgi:uncharacterized damage-inducible protein DinB
MQENSIVTLCRHNLWVNMRLLDVCMYLDAAQLATADLGAYGTIQATLAHLFSVERYYVWLLQGKPADWIDIRMDSMTVPEMHLLGEESGRQLCDLAASDENLPLVVKMDGVDEPWVMSTGYMFTQAAVHATEHCTNITTTLTKMGFKEFDLSAWAFFASSM